MSCLHLHSQRKTLLAISIAFIKSTKNVHHVSSSIASTSRFYATSAELVPRIGRPSIWYSLIPKFLRRSQAPVVHSKHAKSKGWNPATFYIAIFLLIGSNSIQMITLKNDFANFSRKTDARISLLKEIIDRVQKGEDVDVEELLGTGNAQEEQQWGDGKARYCASILELILHEIEEEDGLWQAKVKRNQRKLVSNSKDTIGNNVHGTSEGSGRKSELKPQSTTAANPKDNMASDNARPSFY